MVALRTGNAEEEVAAITAIDPLMARRLLIERALQVIGPDGGVGPQPGPRDLQGLQQVLGLLERHLAQSTLQHRLLLADALRLAGKGDVGRYRSLLEAHPQLADAMLGLAELLHHTQSEDAMAEAMALYRSLTTAPVQAAPDRWWLAQLRMLQLAARAGRPLEERLARVARLKHDHPELGGRRWAGPIQAAAQSGS